MMNEYINTSSNAEKINASNRYLILVVEDDELSSIAITSMLKKDYNVAAAYNGLKALELVQQKKYDAICMDINLGPGMTGIDATKKIRLIDEYRSIPIIAITAYTSIHDREEFLSSGFTHFLPKPFRKMEIVTMLEHALNDKLES